MIMRLGLVHVLLAGNDTWRGSGMRFTECPLADAMIDGHYVIKQQLCQCAVYPILQLLLLRN